MASVTRFQVLRGTTAQRTAITPFVAELVYDTDTNELYMGDGVTPGGNPLSLTNEQIQDIVGALIGDSTTIDVTYDDSGNVLTMDVIETALDHVNFLNVGINSHSTIDSHISSTANPHAVTKAQAGLGNADNTSDIDKPVSTAQALADTAVQDYAVQRANHTGTQLSSTISDFASTVLATILTGLSLATGTVITAADTVLSAFGKLQKQISDNLTTLTNHTSSTSNPHSVTKAQVGLGNVDNTSDADKPVSTAQQTEIDTKNENIQFKDEGSTLGTSGTVNEINFVGEGVTATRATNAVTVTIPKGIDFTEMYIDKNAKNVAYTIVGNGFEGQGTNSVILTKAVLSQFSSDAAAHDIRIYDATNALVICQVTGLTNTNEMLTDMGTISNQAATDAIYEIQVRTPTDGGAKVEIMGLRRSYA